jgi:thioesterase domain-containing protein
MLAVLSRAWGVPLVLVAQRAVSIPKTAREQVSKLISFRQSSPDDIAALAERIGAKAEKVAKLPRYEFVAWDEAESFE